MTMKKSANTNRPDIVLWELLTGILLIGFIGQGICLLLSERTFFLSVGWWAGILVSAFMAYHMYRSLNLALIQDEVSAVSSVRRGAMIRYGAVVVVMLVVYFTGIGNPLAYVFGVLALKFSAYMQPVIHKVFCRIFGIEENDGALSSGDAEEYTGEDPAHINDEGGEIR